MLKPPRLHGAEHLRLFLDFLGFDRACELVDVHPTTMQRWLRGRIPVPQAALQTLYWLTPYGYSAAFAETHITHQQLCWKVREMESRLRPGQVDMGQHLAANESTWNALRPRRLHLVVGDQSPSNTG